MAKIIEETKSDFARLTRTFEEGVGVQFNAQTQNVGKTNRCYGTGADLDGVLGVHRGAQNF
jgi:hypothetical protein